MKWVTRERVKVDRVACPWLIKRFIDPQALFLFVAQEKVLEVAERERATPFDIPGVELGHHNGRCSFEAILERYSIQDPALHLLARIESDSFGVLLSRLEQRTRNLGPRVGCL
jgi:hypothetical protein